MINLTYKWNHDLTLTLEALLREVIQVGTLRSLEKHRAVIELGEWDDLYVRCTGTGLDTHSALAQALARAKWVAEHLAEARDPSLTL